MTVLQAETDAMMVVEDVMTEEVTTEEAIADVTAEAEMLRHADVIHLPPACFLQKEEQTV